MLYPVLLAVHVFCCIVWGGGGVVGGFFLLPAFGRLLAASAGEDRVRTALAQRRYGLTVGVFAGLALLSGALLMKFPLGAGWAYFRTPGGLALGLGALIGLGAYAIGAGVLRRRYERVLALARAGAPAAELDGEQAKAARSAQVAAWHLLAAALLMAFHGVLALAAGR